MNAGKPFVLLFPALSALLVLAGCLTNATHQEDQVPGIRQSAYTYVARDSQLVFQIPRRIDPSCDGSILVYDTLPNTTDSIDFSLTDDTLEWDYRKDVSTDGYTTQYFLRFGRIGSGSGLPGVWRKALIGYKVVSGELPPGIKASMDSGFVIQNMQGAYFQMYLHLTRDSLELYNQINSAGLVSVNWTNPIDAKEQPDSMSWDMDFRIVDRNTVEYHGRRTGETVRVARFDNYDMDYTSDNPSHPHYHYSDIPETCPDNSEPDWYPAFQNANAKGLPSLPKAQIQPNSAKRGDQAPTPLKMRQFFLN